MAFDTELIEIKNIEIPHNEKVELTKVLQFRVKASMVVKQTKTKTKGV